MRKTIVLAAAILALASRVHSPKGSGLALGGEAVFPFAGSSLPTIGMLTSISPRFP